MILYTHIPCPEQFPGQLSIAAAHNIYIYIYVYKLIHTHTMSGAVSWTKKHFTRLAPPTDVACTCACKCVCVCVYVCMYV